MKVDEIGVEKLTCDDTTLRSAVLSIKDGMELLACVQQATIETDVSHPALKLLAALQSSLESYASLEDPVEAHLTTPIPILEQGEGGFNFVDKGIASTDVRRNFDNGHSAFFFKSAFHVSAQGGEVAKARDHFQNAFDDAYSNEASCDVHYGMLLRDLDCADKVRFTSTYIESKYCVDWNTCQIEAMPESFFSWPRIGSATFSTIMLCTQGSLILSLWPSTEANVEIVMPATMNLFSRSMTAAQTGSLYAPRLIILSAGEMTVLPSKHIVALFAPENTTLLTWPAIEEGLYEDDILQRFEREAKTIRRYFPSTQVYGMLQDAMDYDIKVWNSVAKSLQRESQVASNKLEGLLRIAEGLRRIRAQYRG